MRQNAGIANSQRGLPALTVQRSGVFFENNLIRIDVTAFSLSKDKKTAALSLTFQNITQEDIYLALGDCNATLLDNAGTVVPLENYNVTGFPCVRLSDAMYYEHSRQEFARFGPGVKTPVIFKFQIQRDVGFSGSVFTFSAGVLELVESKPRPFTIGLSGIELLN
jgi:hypothetical protein